MADASPSESRQFDLDTTGATDYVEVSAIVVASATGAQLVGGISETVYALSVGGATASGATDAGNPIKVGGVGNSSAPTAVTAGQRVNTWSTLTGATMVGQFAQTGADAVANTQIGSLVQSGGNVLTPTATALWGYNGTTWDRVRTANTGRLQVDIVTGAGGTQYVGDAAATATPTGTMVMGLANTSAPTDVSAANDAVAAWMSPKGALNAIIRDTAGGDLFGTSTALADAISNPTLGRVNGYPMVFNGTTWDRAVSVQAVTAGANTDRGITASGIGPGFARIPTAKTISSAPDTTASVSTLGAASVIVSIQGTYTGLSVQFEGTADGANWYIVHTTSSLQAMNTGAGGLIYQNLFSGSSAAKTYIINAIGLRQVRANVTALTTGSAVIDMTASTTPFPLPSLAYMPLQQASAADAVSNTNILPQTVVGSTGSAQTVYLGSLPMLYNGSTWDRARGAATLADALANPGTGLAQGQNFLMGYNGSTWDRVRTANTGRLQVDVITGGGSSTVVDNAAFTDGTTPVSPAGFIFDDVAGTALTENDAAAARIDSKRAVVMVGEDATTRTQKWAISSAGALSIAGPTAADAALAAQPVTVGGRGSTALPTAVSADGDVTNAWFSLNGALNVIVRDTSGAAVSTGSQYTEDAALGAVGTGIGTLLVGRASAAAPTAVSADADAVGLWALRNGQLVTALSTGTSLIQGFTETGASALTGLAVTGATPHDSVDSGSPLKIGGRASTVPNPTAVATGDRTDAIFSVIGQLRVAPGNAAPFATRVIALDAAGTTNATLSPEVEHATWFLMYESSQTGGLTYGIDSVLFGGSVPRTDFVVTGVSGSTTRLAYQNTYSATGSGIVAIVPVLSDSMRVFITTGSGTGTLTVKFFSGPLPDVLLYRQPNDGVTIARMNMASTALYNGTTFDMLRSVVNGQNTTGTGVAAAGILGQLDDTATGAVTENQFAPVRISTRRALLVEGVASGTNVNVALAASSATVTVDTELPTAAALADATANPTVPMVGAALMGYNGTTWDRVRTANTGRLQVDVNTGAFVASTVVDNAAFTDGTTPVVPAGFIFDEVAGTALTENDAAAARIDSKRAQVLVLEDATTRGQRAAVSAGGALLVDTELTAVAALADATANPTITNISAFGSLFNGTTWDRARGAATLADALANPGTGLAQGQNFLMGYNGTTWDRLRTVGTGVLKADVSTWAGTAVTAAAAFADATALPTVGIVGAALMVANATPTLDRARAANADAQAATGLLGAGNMVYNGTTWDRWRSIGAVITGGATFGTGVPAVGVGPGFARVPALTAATGATTSTADAKGAKQVVFDISGTFTGFAATVQVSYDGANYITANTSQSYIDGLGVSAAGVTISATAATGRVFVNTWGAQSVRLNITAVASGTANVQPTASIFADIPGGTGSVVDTELPTAAALADATANPTVPMVGAALEVFNGTTWDRQRAGGAIADGATGNGVAASASTLWNGTTWDRARGAATLADALANPGTGLAQGQNFLMGYNGTTWDRLRTVGTGVLKTDLSTWAGTAVTAAAALADATAIPTVGIVGAALMVANATPTLDRARGANADGQAATGLLGAGNMLYNGTTWDRARGAATLGEGLANPGTGLAQGQSFGMLYNGSTWDRMSNANRAVDAASGSANTALWVHNSVFNGTNYDRMRAIASLDPSPNLDTGVLAIGDGPGWDRKQNPVGIGATATTNAVTVATDGADVIVFTFTTIGTTPGSMIIETLGADTADTTLWVTAGSVLKLGSELWVSGAFVPAVGDSYMVRTTGLRQVRVRVNAVYASGTVTVKWTGSTGVAIVKGMDLAPQPHNLGQTILNYQSASLGVTTSSAIIALTAGKRVYITNIRVSAGGTTAGAIAIYSGAGAFTEGTSPTALYTELAPSSTVKPGVVLPFAIPWASPNAGEDIRLTTTGLTATHVQIQYYVA